MAQKKTKPIPEQLISLSEKKIWRIFLGGCVLSAWLALLLLYVIPQRIPIPPFVQVSIPSLLLWTVVVNGYAFYSLYHLAQQLNRESLLDGLTTAFNFRYLDQRLAEEYERIRRHGGCAGVLFLDYDEFKAVNDRFGHQVGNVVLRGLAKAMKEQMRSSDVLARVGGDEFIALLPETDGAQAGVLAERLRKTVERYTWKVGEKGSVDFVRISVGVAVYPENGDSMQSVISAADQAVYEAKRQGGNRVHIATEFVSTAESEPEAILDTGGEAPADEAGPEHKA